MRISIVIILSVLMALVYSRPLMDPESREEEPDFFTSFTNAISQFNPAAVLHQIHSFFDSLFDSFQWPSWSFDVNKTPRIGDQGDQGVASGGEGEWPEEPSFDFSGAWWGSSNDNSPNHSGREMEQISYSSDSDS